MTDSFRVSPASPINPVARDFILYCIEHHGTQCPSLYDRMCWVASRHLFRGMGYEGLKGVGISLSLTGVEDTYKMVDIVITEMQNPKRD